MDQHTGYYHGQQQPQPQQQQQQHNRQQGRGNGWARRERHAADHRADEVRVQNGGWHKLQRCQISACGDVGCRLGFSIASGATTACLRWCAVLLLLALRGTLAAALRTA